MIGCEDEKLMQALKTVRREFDKAVQKHPEFPAGAGAVCIIAEEIGELAKEVNDRHKVPDWRDRAITEAAHVAVTAIRTIQMLMGE